jgi:Bacterial capsule synthesis protein PGA_cap
VTLINEVVLIDAAQSSTTAIAVVHEPEVNVVPASTLFFTGDIMLARHVEYMRSLHGDNYSYDSLSFLKDEPAYVVGNFEASIPVTHIKTPDFTFSFSVDEDHIPVLSSAGFTHLSLANNHAYDYGGGGYLNTQTVLSRNRIIPFGHPNVVSSSSLTYLTINDKHIAIIGINTIDDEPEPVEVGALITKYASTSDVVIAYIHWGVEYERRPSAWQRAYANELVAQGVDIIVGHHPHVVQGVEKIGNSMVFYSLGNLIFDQYFSDDVQNGLVLKMTPQHEGIKVALVPVTSIGSKAQPRAMNDEERQVFLTDLILYSDKNLESEILAGEVSIPFSLATSTEMSIME